MSDSAAGWQPDPSGKHDHRYWDGTGWTDHVADGGVAGTDPYEASAAAEPTVVTPVASVEDTTASYPTATTPPGAAPPYVPPMPAAGGGDNGRGSASGGASKRGLVIGGAILAAVAIAVVAFLAFSGDDDDDPTTPVAGETEDTTTTLGTDDDGGERALEDLEDACGDGDFAACDELYFSADLGSELEDFGSTCGGIAEPQSGSCEATNGGEATDAPTSSPTGLRRAWPTPTRIFGLNEEQAECLAGKIAKRSRTASSTRSRPYGGPGLPLRLRHLPGRDQRQLAPVHLGGRFSVKAAMPSAASSVVAVIVSSGWSSRRLASTSWSHTA